MLVYKHDIMTIEQLVAFVSWYYSKFWIWKNSDSWGCCELVSVVKILYIDSCKWYFRFKVCRTQLPVSRVSCRSVWILRKRKYHFISLFLLFLCKKYAHSNLRTLNFSKFISNKSNIFLDTCWNLTTNIYISKPTSLY